ncbi:MAG: hypothetical protein K0R29_600 [Pseudobdellovibrio sp.]|nr:hypothetical protein [Pseudobdellovibrio sp.]
MAHFENENRGGFKAFSQIENETLKLGIIRVKQGAALVSLVTRDWSHLRAGPALPRLRHRRRFQHCRPSTS